MWHWFLHFTGSDNTSGVQYGFWSGFGSDLGEVAIISGLIQLYRKHTCHVQKCWRMGRLNHGPWVVCHKHHPTGPPTHMNVKMWTEHHKETQHDNHSH